MTQAKPPNRSATRLSTRLEAKSSETQRCWSELPRTVGDPCTQIIQPLMFAGCVVRNNLWPNIVTDTILLLMLFLKYIAQQIILGYIYNTYIIYIYFFKKKNRASLICPSFDQLFVAQRQAQGSKEFDLSKSLGLGSLEVWKRSCNFLNTSHWQIMTNLLLDTIGTSPQLRKESQFNSSWCFLFRLQRQSEAWTCGQDLEAETGQQMVGQTSGGDQGTQPMALGRSCAPARKGAKRKKTRYLQWHRQLGSGRGRRHQASGGE